MGRQASKNRSSLIVRTDKNDNDCFQETDRKQLASLPNEPFHNSRAWIDEFYSVQERRGANSRAQNCEIVRRGIKTLRRQNI